MAVAVNLTIDALEQQVGETQKLPPRLDVVAKKLQALLADKETLTQTVVEKDLEITQLKDENKELHEKIAYLMEQLKLTNEQLDKNVKTLEQLLGI